MSVSLAGLDLSTPDGVRVAHERIRQAVRELCSERPDLHLTDSCLDAAVATAQQLTRAGAIMVSLPNLRLGPPRGTPTTRDRLQAAARRVCQEIEDGGGIGSLMPYSRCVDQALRDALRYVESPP